MIWVIALALSAGLVAAIILPIVSKRSIPASEGGTRLPERLAALDRDRRAGLIGEAEAAEAEIEAKRAALAAPAAPLGRVLRPARFAAMAFAGLAPLAALYLYGAIGSPELIGKQPPPPVPEQAIAEMSPEDQQAAIRGMVEGLAARLAVNPEDAEGWRRLARSWAVLNEHQKSADAWRELLKRVEGATEDWRGFAGALMALGPGDGREAELTAAIGKLAALNPDDPMALYFEGAKAQAVGDMRTAAVKWRRLLDVLPTDAPVRPAVEQLIKDAEGVP